MYMPVNSIRCGESIFEMLEMIKPGWEKVIIAYVCCRVAHYDDINMLLDPETKRFVFECFDYNGKNCLVCNFEPTGQVGTFKVPLKGKTAGRPLTHPGTSHLSRDFELFSNSITLGSMYTLFYKICKFGVFDVQSGPVIFRPSKPDKIFYRFDINDCFDKKRFATVQKQHSSAFLKESGLLTYEAAECDDSVKNVEELLEKIIKTESSSVTSNSTDLYSEFKKSENRISNLKNVIPPVWIPLASSVGVTHGMYVNPSSLSCLRLDTVSCVVESALYLENGLKSYCAGLFRDVIMEPVQEEFGASTVAVNADVVNGMRPTGTTYVLSHGPGPEFAEAINLARKLIYEAENSEEKCGFFNCNGKFRVLVRFLRQKKLDFLLQEFRRGELFVNPGGRIFWFMVVDDAAINCKQFYSYDDIVKISEIPRIQTDHDADCKIKGSDTFRARADHG